MKPTLLKIEDRGAGLCAVFMLASLDEMVLTAPNLEHRIRMLEKSNRDASVERDALAQIRRMEGAK